MKTFKGNDKQNYLVFRTPKGSYHVFLEVDAKEAATHCAAPRKATRAKYGKSYGKVKVITL